MHNKDAILNGGTNFDILRAVQADYVVVVQDVRGRYASEGEFNPHFQETEDGVDAFAWAAAQPWSSGVIGTFGGSYLDNRIFHDAAHPSCLSLPIIESWRATS